MTRRLRWSHWEQGQRYLVMPTWNETRAYLAGRYRLRRDDTRSVELAWRFPGTPELQLQTIEVRRAMARSAAVVWCDLGVTSIAPHVALQHNATLAVGALAFADDAYVLRHVLPLDPLAWPALDEVLELIAHEAARLRGRPLGTPSAACFRHLAD